MVSFVLAPDTVIVVVAVAVAVAVIVVATIADVAVAVAIAVAVTVTVPIIAATAAGRRLWLLFANCCKNLKLSFAGQIY